MQRITQVTSADRIHRSAVESASLPAEFVLPSNISLEANDVHDLSGFRICHGIHHIMSAQSVGDLDPKLLAHQLHNISLVMHREPTLPVGIQTFDLACRTGSGSPEKQ